ncbi:hypothetical protein FHL15_009241 [Xylaria flabelliformis]|uniref:Uncharacterized protein n=1 Tax=Xylaria flabelliformis TaxID=2512241 RepID=A0A553HPC6_9PEZI|nr:hypothetical protein FHL15_009241 [Xylaria flabelliformis]
MSLSGNFAHDFEVAIGVAAGVTIAVLILVCVAAHFGPRVCGMGRREKWLSTDVEKSGFQGSADVPLVAGTSNHP